MQTSVAGASISSVRVSKASTPNSAIWSGVRGEEKVVVVVVGRRRAVGAGWAVGEGGDGEVNKSRS